MVIDEMKIHPLADIFPRMPAAEFDALKADIEQHGVREPVWTHDGQLIDGRHRWRACDELGIECPTREYEGADVAAFVVSLNLRRRHLDESQRAMVAARLANLGNGQKASFANLQSTLPPPVTQQEAAVLLNVSPRTVAAAKAVERDALPEIVQAVERGDIAVSLAAEVARLPEEEQQEVASAAPEEIKDVAREVVKRAHVANNSGNNEWYTPPQFIEAARKVMGGIDVDWRQPQKPITVSEAVKQLRRMCFLVEGSNGRV
jgi:ParB-like chromosome segregation protein Spo0J